MIGGAMQWTIASSLLPSHQHSSPHEKEDAGPRFVQQSLKNCVPERASPILHGLTDKTTFLNIPGFITHNDLNVTGYF
jgi:hypothetical protein